MSGLCTDVEQDHLFGRKEEVVGVGVRVKQDDL